LTQHSRKISNDNMIDGASPSRHQNSTGEGATPACVVNMWERLLLETTPARVEENGREQWDRWLSMKALKRER